MINNSEELVKTRRKRIQKGTLVASTNVLRSIKARRLIVKVVYNYLSHSIISEKVCGIRTSFEQ